MFWYPTYGHNLTEESARNYTSERRVIQFASSPLIFNNHDCVGGPSMRARGQANRQSYRIENWMDIDASIPHHFPATLLASSLHTR